jgi:D-alanyl-lipoteichoic acid acyltransferase DltB (MBOAT superfamily)
VRNTFVIFLVSGFWHGANWTFIAWGAFHAILFLPFILLGKNRKFTDTVAEGKIFPSAKELFQMGITFLLVVIGWIFFRANSIGDAFGYFGCMIDKSLFAMPNIISPTYIIQIPVIFSVLLVFEWINRNKQYGFDVGSLNKVIRWTLYLFIIGLIFIFGTQSETFIYFQF